LELRMLSITSEADDEAADRENGSSQVLSPAGRPEDGHAEVDNVPPDVSNPPGSPWGTFGLNAAERDVLFTMAKHFPITFDKLATETRLDTDAIIHSLERLLDMYPRS
jgi:hypothetical protein